MKDSPAGISVAILDVVFSKIADVEKYINAVGQITLLTDKGQLDILISDMGNKKINNKRFTLLFTCIKW